MVYRVLADLVVLAHFAFVAFVAVGSLLSLRWPALVWLHVPALVWAVGIVTIGYECPLTALENQLRRRGGEHPYPGGFVDHYIENVLYPQRFTPLLLTLAAAAVVLGYAARLLRAAGRDGHPPRRLPVVPAGGKTGGIRWTDVDGRETVRPSGGVNTAQLPGGKPCPTDDA